MAYVSLYRKYRPQTFDEVVGQEHVTATLKNAVAAGRVGSGYLFTGTRGTAKTTCARILAKALNCVGEDGARTAPSPIPCGLCPPCRAIAGSAFVDVLEMDAASHGKVDDVRDLVASIKFPPMEGRYKVYIIDEAHQLSRDAMDAFLKTLEEPPDRVVFVLATTELEKLPITIASRCQVFEFKRGSVAAISSRLNAVLSAEGVAVDPSAVTLVARAADGSYRDSLSLLEQVLAFKPTDVTASDVSLVLGTVDDDMLTDVVTCIATNDSAGAFAAAEVITSAGKDVRQFIRTLSTHLRDMLFVAVGARSSHADVTEAARTQAHALPHSVLLRALEILSETERDMRWSNQHRLVLEVTLLRLCALTGGSDGTSPRKEEGARAATQPSAAQVQAVPRQTPAQTDLAPRERRPSPFPDKQAAPAQPIHDNVTAASSEPHANGVNAVAAAQPPKSAVDDDPPVAVVAEIEAADDDMDDEDTSELSMDAEADVVTEVVESVRVTEVDDQDLLRVQQVPTDSSSVPLPAFVVSDGPPELVRLQRAWNEVINLMANRSQSGATMLKDAAPVALNGSVFTLQFGSPFHHDRIEKNERGRKTIEEIINRTLGVAPEMYRIRCVLGDKSATDAVVGAPPAAHQSAQPSDPPHEEPSVLMQEVIAVFGGRVLDE